MVKNVLQPLPVSALFLFSSLASCPGLLTFPAFPISQPVSYFILHPVPAHRASGLTPVSLCPPLLARLLVLRHLPHVPPSLCRCLFPLPLRWAPPSPCNLGTGMSKGQDRQMPCPPFVHREPPWPPATRRGDNEERPVALSRIQPAGMMDLQWVWYLRACEGVKRAYSR